MSVEPHPDDPTTFYSQAAPACPPPPPSPATEPAPSAALTPEEQMEQFAKELKENDWGHQPC